ncbi:AAA family ATPase [Spirosoma soli]|uniref:AAA family ATPase n=1 Tax=Spirosoma soli TaxID=1770529 RepID=A0ABW5LXM6_9BACT
MAKLTVKNVGPIQEAELEVKKHTVFIGPQGTGKSTLAKLIAIGLDGDIIQGADINQAILEKYTIHTYTNDNSSFTFTTDTHAIIYDHSKLEFTYQDQQDQPVFSESTFRSFLNDVRNSKPSVREVFVESLADRKLFEELLTKFVIEKKIFSITSSYIPAERTLLATLNEAIWSLIYSNIDFPKSITSFAKHFEQARNAIDRLNIKFLDIHYAYMQGYDRLIQTGTKFVLLSQSASGYQSIIPLLLVVEHQRQQSQHRFIIEEPELNLYPTAQKDLIYSLISGLDPNVTYQDAEWVITTHSPYVLSSFNTLMLAYKVAQRSDELRAEVEKIIPSRCWINPDEFAAYYVDGGTVRSIISEKTGLIADNELDDVSDDLADEQDKLFALSRSVPRT